LNKINNLDKPWRKQKVIIHAENFKFYRNCFCA